MRWLVVGLFLVAFLGLVVGVGVAPDWLATAVAPNFTIGHLMTLLIHVLAVVVAWLYIYLADGKR